MTGEASDTATAEVRPAHLLPRNYVITLSSGHLGDIATARAGNMHAALDAAEAMLATEARQRDWLPNEDVILQIKRDLSH